MEDRDSSPMERLAKWVFKDKIESNKRVEEDALDRKNITQGKAKKEAEAISDKKRKIY